MGMVYVPGNDGGFQHSGAEDLDRQLREGDGIIWGGDPDLFLAVGVVEEVRNGQKTGRVARRYEVFSEKDGTPTLLGHWRMDEFHRILHDIVLMRAGATGREESVLDRIDKDNAKIEKDNSDDFRQHYGEMLDHAARLVHDRQEGPNTFRQVGGLRDEPKG